MRAARRTDQTLCGDGDMIALGNPSRGYLRRRCQRRRGANMRQLVGVSAGLVLWGGAVVVATTAIMGLLGAGAYLLAALGFLLALGALAAGALLTLLPVLTD